MRSVMPSRRSPGARSKVAALGVAAVLLSTLTALTTIESAGAATTVGPSEAASTPGAPPVVREDSVDISIDRGAQSFYRTSSGNFGPVGGSAFFANTQTCRGDDPAGTNNSPRDVVTVTGPDGAVVLAETSPVRNISIAGALTSPSYQPSKPQPNPSATNYRGDLADSGAYHGFPLKLSLAGRVAGVYTVTTTTTNMVRVGSGFFQIGGPCMVGTPDGAKTFTPGPVVETQTFEYRPFQARFRDAFGGGSVRANITPREFQFNLGAKTSPVYDGSSTMSFYSLDGAFLLPGDPAACAADPSTCLPAAAEACNPDAGCVPRLMIINSPGDATELVGAFDLDTKAFIASAKIGGSRRLLVSLGTDNDGLYHDTLAQLSAAAAEQGVDLASILATQVVASDGTNQTSLSLLNGLQIDPATRPGGVQLVSDATVQAGIVLNIYSSLRLGGDTCVANSASSGNDVDRFTRNEDNGYTVTRTDLAPEVPAVGPVGLIASGPIYHINGRFNRDALVNISTAPIGVDTAGDEPSGYPAWVSPFVSGVNTASPRTFDYLGTATWAASESPIPVLGGCLVIDFMFGTGVAVLNNPLPVGLGTLLDLTSEPNPDAAALFASIDTAVADVLGSVTSNPEVDALLGSLLSGLALPEVPSAP